MSIPHDVIVAILAPNLDDELMSLLLGSLSEMSVKWVLNAISTGAHVMKGKVLGNKMVDLQVRYVADIIMLI